MNMAVREAKRKPTKKPRSLSIRERLLIKHLLEGKTQHDAMLLAGYAKSTAEKLSKSIIGKPSLQSSLEKAMHKHGITDEKLMQTMKDGLDSDKEISYVFHKVKERMGLKNSGKGEEKKADEFDVDFVSVPDHPTRHRFMDSALKLKGHYVDKKEISGPGGGAIPVKVSVNFVGKGDG